MVAYSSHYRAPPRAPARSFLPFGSWKLLSQGAQGAPQKMMKVTCDVHLPQSSKNKKLIKFYRGKIKTNQMFFS
jgi:hypothetical protein